MADKPKYTPHTHEEIIKRFKAWVSLPATEQNHFQPRMVAWHHYCDARDSLPDGTSQRRYLTGELSRPVNPRQFEMFTRRFQS